MRTIAVVLSCLLIASAAVNAQKVSSSKVPSKVTEAFRHNFPGIAHVSWEKEKANYEANFKQDGTSMSALFDATGSCLETETGIAANLLPESVKKYVAQHYKAAKIKEAAKIKLANGQEQFEAEVQGMDLIFDEQGNFLKKVKD